MMDMSQIAFSFDKVSIQKIAKGALIALLGTFVTYLAANVDAIQTAFSQNPVLAALIGAVISILANAVNQFIKGQK
jgi:hypothetical protein